MWKQSRRMTPVPIGRSWSHTRHLVASKFRASGASVRVRSRSDSVGVAAGSGALELLGMSLILAFYRCPEMMSSSKVLPITAESSAHQLPPHFTLRLMAEPLPNRVASCVTQNQLFYRKLSNLFCLVFHLGCARCADVCVCRSRSRRRRRRREISNPSAAINFCGQNKSGYCILVLLEHYSEILQHLIWCDLTLSSLMDLVNKMFHLFKVTQVQQSIFNYYLDIL